MTYGPDRRPFARPIQSPALQDPQQSVRRESKVTHGEKPLHGQLGVPYFLRDLLTDQYSWSHCAGHHQQFSRESDCRRISGFRLLHRLRSNVHHPPVFWWSDSRKNP